MNSLFFLLIVCVTSLPLRDVHYDGTRCANLSDHLGDVSLQSDITALTLTLSVSFTEAPIFSCWACSASSSYCNASIPPTEIDLSSDATYNLRVLAITDSLEWPYLTPVSLGHYEISGDTLTIDWQSILPSEIRHDGVINYCQQTFQLLLLFFVNVELPFPRDLLANVYQSETTTLICNQSSQFFADVNCQQPLEMYSVTYTTEECITLYNTSEEATEEALSTLTTNDPLYWYAQFLLTPTAVPTDLFLGGHLCGENASETLYRSNLYHQQCDNALVFHLLDLMPWYRLAIQVVTLKLNLWQSGYRQNTTIELGRISQTLLLATDLLQHACSQRNVLTVAEGANTSNTSYTSILHTLITLNGNTPPTTRTETCSSLKQYFLTVSADAVSEREEAAPWYFQAFWLFIQPNSAMQRNSIVALTLILLCPLVWLFFIIRIGLQRFNYPVTPLYERY